MVCFHAGFRFNSSLWLIRSIQGKFHIKMNILHRKMASHIFLHHSYWSFNYKIMNFVTITFICDYWLTYFQIFPLPIFYVLNLISGLGGTQRIKYAFCLVYLQISVVTKCIWSDIISSLPMFTVLRRFSILMTMVLEYIILGLASIHLPTQRSF